MAGARSILTAPPYRTPFGHRMSEYARRPRGAAHRKALQLKATTDIVQSLVDRKRGLVTVKEVSALAKVTGTTKLDILRIVETAKETFSQSALDYVNLHKQATELAVANGDAKSLDVATRAAQWAIEKISHDGVRVIDKDAKTEGSGGTKVLIGITLGGANPTYTTEPIIDAQ